LEVKTGANFIPAGATDSESNVVTVLNNAFKGTTANADYNITNPFSDEISVTSAAPGSVDDAPAVYVTDSDPSSDLSKLKGSVVVVYTANSNYKVYGVDNTSSKVGEVTIKK
jgi:hypothetical protein